LFDLLKLCLFVPELNFFFLKLLPFLLEGKTLFDDLDETAAAPERADLFDLQLTGLAAFICGQELETSADLS